MSNTSQNRPWTESSSDPSWRTVPSTATTSTVFQHPSYRDLGSSNEAFISISVSNAALPSRRQALDPSRVFGQPTPGAGALATRTCPVCAATTSSTLSGPRQTGRGAGDLPSKPEDVEALGNCLRMRDQPRHELEDRYLRVTRRARSVAQALIYDPQSPKNLLG
jgi:hypothetical protein